MPSNPQRETYGSLRSEDGSETRLSTIANDFPDCSILDNATNSGGQRGNSDEIRDLENQLQELKCTQEQAEKDKLILIPLELDYKFYFNTQLAAYCLNLETQLSIDHLMIQSDCFIDLLDVEDSTAVCSSSICKKSDGITTLTTYRCQINTTHFELQFRTVEGHYGQVLVYIVPKMNTSTVTACKSIKLSIHPLSLHRLCHHVNDSNGDESYSDR
ncbi:unnamed protein product [Trichobilharzia regenti]|nr:unnamed protein product [Trichobilharzia regenti]